MPTPLLSYDDPTGLCLTDTNRIKRSDFHSEVDLEVVIADHIKRHHAKPKLFIWSGRASKKLEKVTQGRKSLDKSQSV